MLTLRPSICPHGQYCRLEDTDMDSHQCALGASWDQAPRCIGLCKHHTWGVS